MNNKQDVDMVLVNGVWVDGTLTNYSYEQALDMATGRKGGLPEDFDQWTLANKDGWTVAHEAACYHRLPANFNQWGLATKEGWTVAHTVAGGEYLPEDFSQWELADVEGWSVAHEAAVMGRMPATFNQWGITDHNGRTVAEVAFRDGWLSEDDYLDWKIKAALDTSMPVMPTTDTHGINM
jgi:hypothetical protein